MNGLRAFEIQDRIALNIAFAEISAYVLEIADQTVSTFMDTYGHFLHYNLATKDTAFMIRFKYNLLCRDLLE